MSRLKVAVIGVGLMGKNHARVYSELPDVEFTAIADTDDELASNIADKFGVNKYTDYVEMLKNEKLDAISIVVPTALHEEVAETALNAGVHILIEKPIAATVEEGERLIKLANEKDLRLMVGHIVRFNPAIQLLKQKLKNGELGRIFQIYCRRVGPFPTRIRDVGVVVDLAPHDIDVMRFLTDLDPIRVYAETEQRIHTEYEDLLFGLLRFPDGVTGALEINWLTPTKVREILVLGERGLFRVDDLTQDLYFYENAHANGELWTTLQNLKGVSEGSMIRYAVQRQEPLKAELHTFIQAIQNKTEVPISGKDGLKALRLSLALVESSQKNQVIEV